jgi:hypothetical protein
MTHTFDDREYVECTHDVYTSRHNHHPLIRIQSSVPRKGNQFDVSREVGITELRSDDLHSLEGRRLSALGFVLVGVTPFAQSVGSNKGRPLGECVVGKGGEVLNA